MMYLRCLKTIALEIFVLVMYLASIALLITSCVKINWLKLDKLYLGICIAIMVITVAAVFTQISLIIFKTRGQKIFMIKYSIVRAAVVFCINLVELILLLIEFDKVNYPCRGSNYEYICESSEKDYYTGIIDSAQIKLAYATFIYGMCVGVSEIIISIILCRRYETLEPPFDPPQDKEKGNENGNEVVVSYQIANNNTKSKQIQQNNPTTENGFQLTTNLRLNKNEKK